MQHFKSISDYCRGINITSPKHPYFDIRRFEDNMPEVHKQMPPFRHEFYAIAIRSGGDGNVKTGHFTDLNESSIVFFNSPFQILSWEILPNWQGYYLMFGQEFLSKSNVLQILLDQFPFLKIDKTFPLSVKGDELKSILDIFENVWNEYYGDKSDKFEMIESSVYLLLTKVKRLFVEQIDDTLAEEKMKAADLKLTSRYQALIQSSFYPEQDTPPGINLHSTSYYANMLSVHPNHLNAVVKSVSGSTALSHIHRHILVLAKSHLAQTEMSVKEIAYALHFESPSNFSSFFKRNSGQTPLEYRSQA